MNGHAKSCLASVVAGIILGIGATPWAAALADPSPSWRAPATLASTTVTARAHDAPPPANAACAADMIVEGDFCPELLRYICSTGADETQRCGAEYLRGVPCLGALDHRRFCIDRYEWPNREGAKPEVYVNWHEARDKCNAAGKRLCRRSEWVLACEGPKRLPFPWGFVRQPSPCNIDRTPIPFDAKALEQELTREAEIARLWQADPIGSHPDCVSGYGVADLAGNVDEWTDNTGDNPNTRSPSTLNGGYWGPVRNTCRLTTKSHGPLFRFYQVGFRCCDDTADGVTVPPPAPWIDEGEPIRRGDPNHPGGPIAAD